MKQRLVQFLRRSCRDDQLRQATVFQLLNLILATISVFMAVVNHVTGEWEMRTINIAFATVTCCNCVLSITRHAPQRILSNCFAVEVFLQYAVFIVTGLPEGFSVIWVLLVPCFSLQAFTPRRGLMFISGIFLMLVFFFWTPWGKFLLRYNYTSSIQLRLPFVYLAITGISLYLEATRTTAYHLLQESEQQYRYLSRHDPLTKLYNRSAFIASVDHLLEGDQARSAAFLLIDLDDFKCVNDQYGHDVGDIVLVKVAEILSIALEEGALLSRWGGEEFLMYLPTCVDAYHTAEDIRRRVEHDPIEARGHALSITVSIGLTCDEHATKSTWHQLVKQADEAMYQAKQNGKNQTALFTVR